MSAPASAYARCTPATAAGFSTFQSVGSLPGGSPAACKSLATLAQFGQLFKKLDLITAEMGRALYSGSVEASPVKGAHDACQYCPYDSVCAYRAGEPRNTFAVDNEKVFEELSNEFGGERDAELDSTAAAGD